MAGRCSLCFLEQVNQLIGNDHLFKRSILLIKAWCHYESRILGAHHGLISTFSLDIMILCIINMFHSSLKNPLAVLYKFLDYYSTFEWERYCITIYGRVAIPSLPNTVVEKEEGNGCYLLLTKEFLENCIQYFSIPTGATETGDQFPVKHMNIMDPLKSNNNLGRSVNRGNFYRIKSALNLGTHKLKQVLMGPAESIDAELKKFFHSTLNRNFDGRRPDVQFRFPVFGDVEIQGIYNLGRSYGNIHGPSYCSIPVPTQPGPHISHCRAQNLPLCMHYRWTDFSKTMMNQFIPREIGHQNVSRVLSSAFGVQEREKILTRGPPPSQWSIAQNAMARGRGTYVPNMGAESSLSRGARTFIFPMLTGREQWVPQGMGTGMPETRMEGTVDWQGPSTSIADMSYIDADSWDYKKKRVVEWVEVHLKEAQNEEYETCFDLSKEEFSFLLSSKRALASESGPPGVDNEGCGSGVKMASPPRGHHSFWPAPETEALVDQLPLLPTKSEPSVVVPPEGCQFAQPPAVVSEDKAGSSGNFFELSLEEFPLLPSQKKAVAPPTREPVWPATAAQPSEVAQMSSPRHIGAFRHSPPPSPLVTEELDSGVSTPVGPIIGFSTDAVPGPQLEPSNSNEEVVVAEGYQLEDEKDFPPLGL